jgi:NAD-dependent dihydropyrimidine dehydrogenase PreA subunit
MYYFTHHKEIITQQYPDNRDTLTLPERFKGEVVMPHNDKNEHRCTGCTACELACPNGTIKVITKFDVTPEGKKKKAIDKLVYHLDGAYHLFHIPHTTNRRKAAGAKTGQENIFGARGAMRLCPNHVAGFATWL